MWRPGRFRPEQPAAVQSFVPAVPLVLFLRQRLLQIQVPALPADVAGLLCAVAGGVSVRMLMWVCATGYLNLFAHTVPSVMLNL